MRNIKIINALCIILMLSSSRLGKLQEQKFLETLGEPLVHRIAASRETLIYNHERGDYFFLYGTYEGNELVLRLKNQIVVEAKIEKTGNGWGFFAPATSNNPGTRRSAR